MALKFYFHGYVQESLNLPPPQASAGFEIASECDKAQEQQKK